MDRVKPDEIPTSLLFGLPEPDSKMAPRDSPRNKNDIVGPGKSHGTEKPTAVLPSETPRFREAGEPSIDDEGVADGRLQKPSPITEIVSTTNQTENEKPFLLAWMRPDTDESSESQPAQQDQMMMDDEAVSPSKRPCEQILTDRGAAYRLMPLHEFSEHGGASLSGHGVTGATPGAGSTSPDYIVTEDKELQRLPVITGTQQVTDATPFVVRDPRSGQDLVAVPAQSADDLQGMVGFTDDPREEPLMIQDMQTGDAMIAHPSGSIPGDLQQSLTKDSGFDSRPTSVAYDEKLSELPMTAGESSPHPSEHLSDSLHTPLDQLRLSYQPGVVDHRNPDPEIILPPPEVTGIEEDQSDNESTLSDFYTPDGSPVPWEVPEEALPLPQVVDQSDSGVKKDHGSPTKTEPLMSAADLLEQTLQIQPKVVLHRDPTPPQESLLPEDEAENLQEQPDSDSELSNIEQEAPNDFDSHKVEAPLQNPDLAATSQPVEQLPEDRDEESKPLQDKLERPESRETLTLPLKSPRDGTTGPSPTERDKGPTGAKQTEQKIDQLNTSWRALQHKVRAFI